MNAKIRKALPPLFFVFYAACLWQGIHPAFYLIRSYGEFYTVSWFFDSLMRFPGDPAEYLARFVTHCFAFPLLASAGMSALAAAVYYLGLRTFGGRTQDDWIAFLPLAVLLCMHTLYEHRILFDLNVLFLLLFLRLFVRSARLPSIWAFAVFPLLQAGLFYLSGAVAAVAFAVAAFAYLFLFEKGKPAGRWIYAAECAAVWLAFCLLFQFSLRDLHQETTDLGRIYPFRYAPLALYLSVCLQPVCRYVCDRLSPCGKARRMFLPAMLAGTGLCLLSGFDADERNGLAVQHYALNGEWEKALEYAAGCKYPDKDAVLYTNEALYHTGRIYDELFLYNQSLGAEGLLSAEISNYSEITPNQDVFLHLGALSLSIVWGTEACNVYGANPYVLKNLAKAYLAGGYPAEAEKILTLLSHTPFQREWVARYRKLAADTLLLNEDRELAACKQAQAPAALVSRQSAMLNLYLISQENAASKMAYDYLLIGSLLDNQIDNFAASIAGLKAYGYASIPKLYMEGLIYHSLYAERSPVDVREFAFDEQILYRFESFRNDLLVAWQNPGRAQEWLKSKYRDTLWYYILFQSRLSDEEKEDAFFRIAR